MPWSYVAYVTCQMCGKTDKIDICKTETGWRSYNLGDILESTDFGDTTLFICEECFKQYGEEEIRKRLKERLEVDFGFQYTKEDRIQAEKFLIEEAEARQRTREERQKNLVDQLTEDARMIIHAKTDENRKRELEELEDDYMAWRR